MEGGPSVLWTALPMELVVQGLEPDEPRCMAVEIEGRLVEVMPAGDGTATVQRLISTDPSDYLDGRWQPGVRVALPVKP